MSHWIAPFTILSCTPYQNATSCHHDIAISFFLSCFQVIVTCAWTISILHSGYAYTPCPIFNEQNAFLILSVLVFAGHWIACLLLLVISSLLSMPDNVMENANIDNEQEEGHSKKQQERKVKHFFSIKYIMKLIHYQL